MALAHLLSRWSAKSKGLEIHALIVDHDLREGSAKEARQVKKALSGFKNLQAHILTRPKPGTRSKMLEQARFDRYELMAKFCKSKEISHLFLAHHQDDQAETLLLRLAGGSGLDGLAAMRAFQEWGDGLTLMRPLLSIPKERLVATCDIEGLAYVQDPTNEAAAYARPRLRAARDVLEREGLSAKRLATTAARLERARLALDLIADQVYQSALEEKNSKRIVFKLNMLYEQPQEIVLRLFLKACEELRPALTYGPRLEKLEQIAADVCPDIVFRKRTLGGVIFETRKRDNLFILAREA